MKVYMVRKIPVCKFALVVMTVLLCSLPSKAEDYSALYKKLSEDVMNCSKNRDANQRIKCFDKMAADLDLRQSLFPLKEKTPIPDKDPFDISAQPTATKVQRR